MTLQLPASPNLLGKVNMTFIGIVANLVSNVTLCQQDVEAN